MKMNRSFTLSLLPVLAYAAAMHMALMLFAFREAPIADHGGMVLWWGFLILYNGVIALFLRRPRQLRSIVLLSGAVVLCQLGVTLWLVPVFPSVTWWLAAVGMWAALYYKAAFAYLEGVKPEALMSTFEVTVLTLFAAAFIVSGGAMAEGVLAHLIVGLLCILTAMMQLRTRHTRIDADGKRPMVRLLLPLLLLGTAGCALLLVALLSGHAAAILTRFTAWLLRMSKLAANAVGAFFLWLFSLFPEVDGDLGGEGFEAPPLPAGALEGMPETSGILLYVLIAAFLGALLFLVMKIWRTVRLQGQRQIRPTAKAVVVGKRSFMEVLMRFFRRMVRRIRFELHYLRCRNTPEGLLVWLERRMVRKRMGRKPGESIRTFLRRMGEQLPDCAEMLSELAKCLDCCYFGGGDTLPAETVREMRRAIGKAMTEQNSK